MNPALTALISARDERDRIVACVAAAKRVAGEVLVVDNGSTDGTQQLAAAAGARVLSTAWLGYGATKNWGAERVSTPWVLSLDADEVPDAELAAALLALKPVEGEVYGLRRLTEFCGHWVRHGSWSRDTVWRVYARAEARWSDRAVHERLQLSDGVERRILPGRLLHYSYPDLEAHRLKQQRYARLGARALFAAGKRATLAKRLFAPGWRALRGYVLRGGWRDGWAGRQVALGELHETRLKYRLLAEHWRAAGA